MSEQFQGDDDTFISARELRRREERERDRAEMAQWEADSATLVEMKLEAFDEYRAGGPPLGGADKVPISRAESVINAARRLRGAEVLSRRK